MLEARGLMERAARLARVLGLARPDRPPVPSPPP